MRNLQASTWMCVLSVFAACVLLLGPTALSRVGANLFSNYPARAQQELQRRNERCAADTRTGDLNSQSIANEKKRALSDHQAGANDTSLEDGRTKRGNEFALEEYRTVVGEIRERLSNENALFALKFTLVGAIIWMLFSVFGRREHDFQRFAQDRRAAVFLMTALLCGAIVDTRLRFNAKVIESLGDWVWCFERSAAAGTGGVSQPWEHFLHIQLGKGSLPVMRYFCHFLTPLLFAVGLYLFVVLARTVHRSTMTMMINGGALFFALLFVIACSHEPLLGGGWLTLTISFTAMSVGWWCLREGCRLRFGYGNVLAQTKNLVFKSTGERREELLFRWVEFGAVHRSRELMDCVLQLANSAAAEEVSLSKAIMAVLRAQLGAKVDLRQKPGDSTRRGEWCWVLANSENAVLSSDRLVRSVAKEISLAVKDRYHADLAEDFLWKAFFEDQDGPTRNLHTARRYGDREAFSSSGLAMPWVTLLRAKRYRHR